MIPNTAETARKRDCYTATITAKDNGYENVCAYGDWVSVDAEGGYPVIYLVEVSAAHETARSKTYSVARFFAGMTVMDGTPSYLCE